MATLEQEIARAEAAAKAARKKAADLRRKQRAKAAAARDAEALALGRRVLAARDTGDAELRSVLSALYRELRPADPEGSAGGSGHGAPAYGEGHDHG